MQFKFQKCSLVIIFACAGSFVFGQPTSKSKLKPDSVEFSSGSLKLKGLLWKPAGKGPFPAVLYNHGSEAKPERFIYNTPDIFIEHGYAYFVPFRRGQGLSKGQGRYVIDDLDSAGKAGGPEARFDLMINLLRTSQLEDQVAGLAFLKAQPGIDPNRIAVIGVSFGGIQTMLIAAQRSSGIKAAVNFAGAAMMWEKTPKMGQWMKTLIPDVTVPVFFIQAENDFSTKPSVELSNEMKRLGKPYQIKIYPPRGTTPMEGHTFIDEIDIWGADVFPWLDQIVKK